MKAKEKGPFVNHTFVNRHHLASGQRCLCGVGCRPPSAARKVRAQPEAHSQARRSGGGLVLSVARDPRAPHIPCDSRIATHAHGQDFLKLLPRQNVLKANCEVECHTLTHLVQHHRLGNLRYPSLAQHGRWRIWHVLLVCYIDVT